LDRTLRSHQFPRYPGRIPASEVSCSDRARAWRVQGLGQGAGFPRHRCDVGARVRGPRLSAPGLRRRSVALSRSAAPGTGGAARVREIVGQLRGEERMSDKFRVAITRDVLDSRGEPAFGRAALSILERAPDIEWEYLPKVMPE